LLVTLFTLLVSALAIHLMRLATVETRLAAQLVRKSQLDMAAGNLAEILAATLRERAKASCALPVQPATDWPVGVLAAAPEEAPGACGSALAWPAPAAQLVADMSTVAELAVRPTVARLTPANGAGQPLRLGEAQASSAIAVRTDLFELSVVLEQGGLRSAVALGLATWSSR